MTIGLRLLVVALSLAAPAALRAQPRDLASYVLFAEQRVSVAALGVVEGGDVGANGLVSVGARGSVASGARLAGDDVRVGGATVVESVVFFRDTLRAGAAILLGGITSPIPIPLLTLPAPPAVAPGTGVVEVAPGATATVPAGAYAAITAAGGSTTILAGGEYDVGAFRVRGSAALPASVVCAATAGCVVRVQSDLALAANAVGLTGGPLVVHYAGTRPVLVGRAGAQVRAMVRAPLATVRLRSSLRGRSDFTGQFVGRKVLVGAAATLRLGMLPPPVCGNDVLETGEECDGTDSALCPGQCTAGCQCPVADCGDGVAVPPEEDCDGADDAACPGECESDCQCPPLPGTAATLHAIGPSVLQNATSFGVQLFGRNFADGAQVELSDRTSGAVLATLPADRVSTTEMTALVPAGLPVPSGIQRELTARVVNPGAPRSGTPSIGHCATDRPDSPTACVTSADCPPGAGSCLTGDQRLTLFNDLVFLNPNSAVAVPPPFGVCADGSPCDGAPACAGIGDGACAPKLYVTPQQHDELWVYDAGRGLFVDQDGAQAGIQGIPVGDNPFHVELLTAGGPARAWVVNRFDDSVSIVDPATDAEVARVTGAALGAPGRLRMETEIEFNRAGTRAYLSNENLDEVQVLDIAGPRRDAPVLVASIDVGVNPRGMATNTADTRLYVANIQSADVSVVDIAPGSPTENQVLRTIAPRATDDIVGGRADGWEPFVIGGRAPRGIVFSDANDAVFVTSIGPQTGPRQGVVLTGGAIINPTVTAIDAATDTIVAHVALDVSDRDRPSCTDPELMALDDARDRLYVTCQGSGTVSVLDTAALRAGSPAELAILALPLPTDATVPTLAVPTVVGPFGAKVCGAFTSTPGAPCTTDAGCGGCPSLVEGLPVACCAVNNPIGLHNGPRGIALSADGDALYVVNQFTTSVATLDVSPADPTLATTTRTTSFPGAFGADTAQRDRRLGQIEFFTDVKKTGVSCATCHIDDHQDGVFFEADVRGPRLRRVLSVRSTRDFSPLLQDQLVPDLTAFTDIVVHAERGGKLPCIPCIEINGAPFCFGSGGSECTQTSNSEAFQNAAYAKAITFFPNPNLAGDGAFSTAVPLPGGGTGDARRGAAVFDALDCATCHPEPLFTIDQFRAFDVGTLGAPVRMREVGTPVAIPLRSLCQDFARPPGFDGSSGFTVPTLRGIWDTFPLLLSGSAGLGAVGSEPVFTPCTPGSAGCCAQLASPLNPGGTAVPEQHLEVTTKDAIRAVLTPPLAVPFTGHGTALGLTPTELNALIAYLRSL
jgi:DNA-binding beta-propeller fold protein YncE